MKIAVFLSNHPEESGGGFTFESDAFESLVELAPTSSHQFVVFGWNLSASKLNASAELPYVSLHQSFGTRLGCYLKRKMSGSTYSGSLDEVLLQNQIDMIVSLSTGAPRTDFPFITVVWDLQHRLQPYFPEVSAEGQWGNRENSCANVLGRASAVIVGTEAGRHEVEKFYQVPSERIWKLPHATPRFALEAPVAPFSQILKKRGLSENYLIYPAQFWPHKNHVGLLDALKILRDEYRLNFDMVFVGSDKGNRNHVLSLARQYELSSRVHCLGFIPREELIMLYRGAFALTYASFCGPENLPPLEAFALGCPVIATKVSGSEEQFGDAALLVNPANPQEIASAVRKLKDDPELRNTLIERGRARAKKWTSHDYVRGLFRILDHFEPIRRTWSNRYPYHQL
jgi:glycosyltransferase involved in cell wall biosynthesis